MGNEISNAVDSIPVVGHIKGGIHYACGDNKGGDAAMKSSSRSVGVVGGGIAGFCVGGPLGAAAGGVAGGAAMDGAITGIESAIVGKYTPYGLVENGTDIAKDPGNVGAWVDGVTTIAMDAAGGKIKVKAKVKPKVKPSFKSNLKHATKTQAKKEVKSVKKAAKKDAKQFKKDLKNDAIHYMKTNCPGYHGLKSQETTSHGWQCDGCKKYLEKYTIVYGCRKCDYDLCESCYSK